jgi:AAHS family 4-hydroxybenzoate transporter-like MFS transporter
VATFTTLALIFDGFDIQAIAFAAPRLLVEWGIDKPHLTPVIGAGLLGMAFGALGIGAIGDHFGRRRALIASVIVVALGSWLSAYATSPTELAIYRLVTGIGLGGTLPNAAALIAEFAPLAVRNVVLSVTVVGVPIGGMIGASIAADVIPAYGWRSIFIAGAILPALLAIAMLLWLPESPRFLAARPGRWPQLAKLLNRLTRSDRFHPSGPFHIREQPAAHVGIAALFTREFRYDTLIVWLIFFTNVFAVYAFFSWLPTVLAGAGLELATAIRGSLVFNLGGIFGALTNAVLMNRIGSRATLTVFGIGAVVSTFAAALVPLEQSDALWQLLALMAISGACITALQVGMYAVAAYIYPTRCRASGLGWALGIARFGGILSSFAGTVLVGPAGGVTGFFGGIAVILLFTLLGIVLLRGHMPRNYLGSAKT